VVTEVTAVVINTVDVFAVFINFSAVKVDVILDADVVTLLGSDRVVTAVVFLTIIVSVSDRFVKIVVCSDVTVLGSTEVAFSVLFLDAPISGSERVVINVVFAAVVGVVSYGIATFIALAIVDDTVVGLAAEEVGTATEVQDGFFWSTTNHCS
jgi:hypothetical protein